VFLVSIEYNSYIDIENLTIYKASNDVEKVEKILLEGNERKTSKC